MMNIKDFKVGDKIMDILIGKKYKVKNSKQKIFIISKYRNEEYYVSWPTREGVGSYLIPDSLKKKSLSKQQLIKYRKLSKRIILTERYLMEIIEVSDNNGQF